MGDEHRFTSAAAEPDKTYVLPLDPARAERKAYAECAVRVAFSIPLPAADAAAAFASAAVKACAEARAVMLAKLADDLSALPDAAEHSADLAEQIDVILLDRLAMRLRESMPSEPAAPATTSGSSI